MDTVKALMAAQSVERRVFARMIDMEMDVELSRRVMAYWMYLESLGCKDFMRRLASHDDKFISLLFVEAESALACLQPDSTKPISSTSPITFNLANPTFSLYEIVQDRERVSRGVSDLYDGVCSMVFEDILEERGLRGGNVGGGKEKEKGKGKTKLKPSWEKEWLGKLVRAAGEGTSQEGAAEILGGVAGSGGSGSGDNNSKVERLGPKLNASAKEWHPSVEREEESRCLYITFSKGFPLSELQIYWFFTWRFGPYIEKIYIHQPRDSVPVFGKITFKVSFVPVLILNGEEQVKFYIDGRTILCKKYNRRNRDA